MKFVDDAAGLLPRDALAASSGFAFIKGMLDGEYPMPPIARSLNYWLEAVEKGSVTFRGQPGFDTLNPLGTVHGGWFGTVLDSCMACAVQTMLPAGQAYTTLEYKINNLRPLHGDGVALLAKGTVDHVGRRTGVATGQVIGAADGKLYATGSTTCLVFEI